MSKPNPALRVGAVTYLNSKPLIEGLAELAPNVELVLDFPSRLADELSRQTLDVALIPSIECWRNPDYEIISDACVATSGPVLSVKVYSRVPISEIRTLALDEGSRTSAALVLILLAERYGIKPRTEPLPLGRSVDGSEADAVLLIGDRAIHPCSEGFVVTWDLGQEWYEWTGLPFVFAMWAARSSTELGDLEEALSLARDRGVERIEHIARREAEILGLSERTAYDYLTNNLHFCLGSAEQSGLTLFHQLSTKLGLVPEGHDLVFRNCISAG
jgi:chorismate dehydratase